MIDPDWLCVKMRIQWNVQCKIDCENIVGRMNGMIDLDHKYKMCIMIALNWLAKKAT